MDIGDIKAWLCKWYTLEFEGVTQAPEEHIRGFFREFLEIIENLKFSEMKESILKTCTFKLSPHSSLVLVEKLKNSLISLVLWSAGQSTLSTD